MKRRQRNSTFEIMKLMAVLLIIYSSALPYGATYVRGRYDDIFVNLNLTQFSATQIIFSFFRWCGQIGDTLFIAVSAYFLCDDEKIKLEKPIRMVIDTWVLSVIGLIGAFFFMVPSIKEIIKSLMPVRYSLNWFVGCYIIYYLIHPLLNRAVKGLEQTDFKKMVIILFALYSVLGCVQQEYYYTNLVGFICIHYFVMYYKKYGINAGTNTREILSTGNIKRDVIAIVLSVAAILIWICVLNFVGQYITVLSDKGLFLCTFMTPLIVVISLAALDIAVHTKPHEIKWVNAFTKNSLLIYLLHGSYYWLTYGKYTLHAVLNSCGIPALGRMLIISAIYMIATPLLSAIYNKITDKRFNRISSLLAEKIMK